MKIILSWRRHGWRILLYSGVLLLLGLLGIEQVQFIYQGY